MVVETPNSIDQIKALFPSAKQVNALINEEIFYVLIDQSSALQELIKEAQKLKDLPFEEKLQKVIKLTTGAIPQNAVELTNSNERAKDIVYNEHLLSTAIDEGLGSVVGTKLFFFLF